jgi:hypothetical protein
MAKMFDMQALSRLIRAEVEATDAATARLTAAIDRLKSRPISPASSSGVTAGAARPAGEQAP